MNLLDWGIVGVFLLGSLVVGLLFTRRAGRSLKEYFLSGRSLPWWVLGTSMVATTFASDTPLAVTEYVRSQGIWGNWFWWTLALGHVLAALVFSRLWRRARVLTDNELLELRYHGRPAAFLRGFKAVYFSTLYNFIVMGWVTAAMSTVFSAFLDIPLTLSVVLSMTVALVYSLLAGLWGVVFTDLFQFVFAMIGCVVFAALAADQAGGMSTLVQDLNASGKGNLLSLIPPAGAGSDVWWTFGVYVMILWWANHGADGGGYLIQRMMSAKNERHALIGTSWFVVAHYVLRMWPWIVVALASIVLVPRLGLGAVSDREAYPALMSTILPAGLRGLFMATFLAAFMSTIVTHVNWGASYVVNDVYKRFIRPSASERHYLVVSKIASLINMIVGGVVALFVTRITAAWELVWAMGAGIGAVLILRWFWWRINAWSEISAMVSSLCLTAGLYLTEVLGGPATPFYLKALIVVGGSLVVCFTVTLCTAPEPRELLLAFYQRVRPGGWWPFPRERSGLGRRILVAWLSGVGFVYGSMFSIGSLVLQDTRALAWQLPVAGLGVLGLWWGLRGTLGEDAEGPAGQ